MGVDQPSPQKRPLPEFGPNLKTTGGDQPFVVAPGFVPTNTSNIGHGLINIAVQMRNNKKELERQKFETWKIQTAAETQTFQAATNQDFESKIDPEASPDDIPTDRIEHTNQWFTDLNGTLDNKDSMYKERVEFLKQLQAKTISSDNLWAFGAVNTVYGIQAKKQDEQAIVALENAFSVLPTVEQFTDKAGQITALFQNRSKDLKLDLASKEVLDKKLKEAHLSLLKKGTHALIYDHSDPEKAAELLNDPAVKDMFPVDDWKPLVMEAYRAIASKKDIDMTAGKQEAASLITSAHTLMAAGQNPTAAMERLGVLQVGGFLSREQKAELQSLGKLSSVLAGVRENYRDMSDQELTSRKEALRRDLINRAQSTPGTIGQTLSFFAPGAKAPVSNTFEQHIKRGSKGGLDFAAPEGTPVQTPVAGTVTEVGTTSANGNFVTITTPDGDRVKMLHFQFPSNLRIGQRVQAGQMVGAVGQTGNAHGPHLHVSLFRGGKQINPAVLLQQEQGGQLAPEEELATDLKVLDKFFDNIAEQRKFAQENPFTDYLLESSGRPTVNAAGGKVTVDPGSVDMSRSKITESMFRQHINRGGTTDNFNPMDSQQARDFARQLQDARSQNDPRALQNIYDGLIEVFGSKPLTRDGRTGADLALAQLSRTTGLDAFTRDGLAMVNLFANSGRKDAQGKFASVPADKVLFEVTGLDKKALDILAAEFPNKDIMAAIYKDPVLSMYFKFLEGTDVQKRSKVDQMALAIRFIQASASKSQGGRLEKDKLGPFDNPWGQSALQKALNEFKEAYTPYAPLTINGKSFLIDKDKVERSKSRVPGNFIFGQEAALQDAIKLQVRSHIMDDKWFKEHVGGTKVNALRMAGDFWLENTPSLTGVRLMYRVRGVPMPVTNIRTGKPITFSFDELINSYDARKYSQGQGTRRGFTESKAPASRPVVK